MSLASIFQLHLQNKLYTHAYCARGSISNQDPVVEYAHLPESRDVFDLASLTKALVTTPLVFAAVIRRGLPIEGTVGDWLEGRVSGLDDRLNYLKISDLLAHKSGLPAWRNFWICNLGVKKSAELADPFFRSQHIFDVLNRTASAINKKQGDVYSDVGFILLGFVLEKIYDQDLDKLFEDFLRSELLLSDLDLGFIGNKFNSSRIVPTGFCSIRQRVLCGEVHDENCASLGGVAGHAGVFGTGAAIARFLRALAASQVGKTLLSANATARLLPVSEPPNASLQGWRQGADPSSSPFGAGAAIGHWGFTGVGFWLWPETQEYAMLLTNRVISGRNQPGIAQMRREVFSELARNS
jgi:CubicO group peptidase (beta-lactamase class C family)